jgi:hypothetical protein
MLFILATTSHAMTRYIGDPADNRTAEVSQECGGSDQVNFAAGRCDNLMRCVLDFLPSDAAAGFQSGGKIAGLVPTLLVLIAASPLELVQLALLSPHRALATVCFGIGLPSGLFRQLRDSSTSLTNTKPDDPKTREWGFCLPASEVFGSFSNNGGWSSIGAACFVGSITATASFAGSDAAVHMTEETEDASKAVPRKIMFTIAVNGVMAFIFIITYVSSSIETVYGTLPSVTDRVVVLLYHQSRCSPRIRVAVPVHRCKFFRRKRSRPLAYRTLIRFSLPRLAATQELFA